MLKKIISGCQTGADRAGLIAAKSCGLETGGYVCTKNKTELGYEPELISGYNLTELNTFDYPKRTLANVNAADATWIFYRGKLEKGSALTEKYCNQLKKPYLTIQIDNLNKDAVFEDYSNWLILKNIKVLNIAGNRESVAPGIQQEVIELLTKVFKNVRFI
jgi:hypothetical protein